MPVKSLAKVSPELAGKSGAIVPMIAALLGLDSTCIIPVISAPGSFVRLVNGMVKTLALIVFGLLLAACNRSEQPKGPEHHYSLSGKITALDRQRQTATVDAAAIPNYMEAMTMEYPVRSKHEFDSLRVGERITATIDVAADETYALSNVKPGSAAK